MRSLLPAPASVVAFVEASFRARISQLPSAAPVDPCTPEDAHCPRCHAGLDLHGYRRTETPYMVEEILRCHGCCGELLLYREERA